jgi:hypothetical protein
MKGITVAEGQTIEELPGFAQGFSKDSSFPAFGIFG